MIANWLEANLGQGLMRILQELVDDFDLPEIRNFEDALEVLKRYFEGTLPADQQKTIDRIVKALSLQDQLERLKSLIDLASGLPRIENLDDLRKLLKKYLAGELDPKQQAAIDRILAKVGLDDEVETLRTLIGAKADLPKVDDWVDALLVADAYFSGTLSPKEMKAFNTIFDKLKLTKYVDRLRDYYAKILDNRILAALKTPVGRFDKLAWPISKDLSFGPLQGPWNAVLDLSVRGELEASLSSHGASFPELGLDAEPNHSLLALSLDASLKASAGGGLPMGLVSAKARAETAGRVDLDYFFNNRNDHLLIQALANDLTNLPSPLNAKHVGSAWTKGLEAIYFNATGAVDLGLDVNASGSWAGSFSGNIGEISEPLGVGATAAASYKASLILKGAFTLVVRPEDEDTLLVSLEKTTESERKSAFAFSADVGITGLDKLGTAVIERYVPDSETLLEKVRDFLNPGDLLKELLQENLEKFLDFGPGFEDLESRLIATLLGNGSARELGEVLGTKVREAANRELGLLASDAKVAADDLLTRVVGELSIDDDLKDDLIEKGSEKLAEWIEELKGKLGEKVKELISENKNKLDKVLKPIEDAGIEVGKLTGDINRRARDLLAPVIKFIQRFGEVRQKVLKGLEDMSRVHIGVGFSRELNVSSSQNTLLQLKIDTAFPEACAVYRQIMTGHFGEALASARNKKGADGITLVSGSFERLLKRKVTTGFTLHFAGIKLGRTTVLCSDLQVQWEPSGAMTIAADGRALKRVQGFKENRSVQFTNMAHIAAKQDADTTALLSGGVALSLEDESLKIQELRQFFGSLETNGLIADGTTARVVQKFEDLGGARMKEGLAGVSIDLAMPLLHEDFGKLAALGRNTAICTAIGRQLDTYRYLRPQRRQELEAAALAWPSGSGDLFQRIEAMGRKFGYGALTIDYPTGQQPSGAERLGLTAAWDIGKNALSFADFCETLSKILALELNEQNFRQKGEELRSLNRRILQDIKPWLKNRGMIAGFFQEEVRSVTLAFLLTVAELIGRNLETAPLVPMLKWKGELVLLV